MKKLPGELWTKLDEVKTKLDDAVSTAQEYHDGKSQSWQDGDKGTNYQSWIETLEAAVDALEAVTEAPE